MNTINVRSENAGSTSTVRFSRRTSRNLGRLATLALLTSFTLGSVAMPLISAAPRAEKKGGKH
ncbi:MAG: hypothetical protein M3Z20_07070 [Chloroflexota bacterium]|nr:hypothetical protein [Chloroflexota bacterium]